MRIPKTFATPSTRTALGALAIVLIMGFLFGALLVPMPAAD